MTQGCRLPQNLEQLDNTVMRPSSQLKTAVLVESSDTSIFSTLSKFHSSLQTCVISPFRIFHLH